MTDSMHQPRDSNGQYVSLREFIERILDEKDKSAEFKRVSLELALHEAKANIEKELGKAKDAADKVSNELGKRISQLESGGAPFASRLDSSLEEL
jgi:long-subunit acyl-CoA synthetase (AMP-forming)